MTLGKLTLTSLATFAASCFVSCERMKPRTNEPPPEIQELISRSEKADALIVQFKEEMRRLFPGEDKQPELLKFSIIGTHFGVTLKEASQQGQVFEVLAREMVKSGIPEARVDCMEQLAEKMGDPPLDVVRAVGVFRLINDGTITELPNLRFGEMEQTDEELLEKIDDAVKQRARGKSDR